MEALSRAHPVSSCSPSAALWLWCDFCVTLSCQETGALRGESLAQSSIATVLKTGFGILKAGAPPLAALSTQRVHTCFPQAQSALSCKIQSHSWSLLASAPCPLCSLASSWPQTGKQGRWRNDEKHVETSSGSRGVPARAGVQGVTSAPAEVSVLSSVPDGACSGPAHSPAGGGRAQVSWPPFNGG